MHGDPKRKKDKSKEKFDALFNLARREAYDSFWAYRQFINPDMIIGWWQREIAYELHRFWLEHKAGLRPKLILQSPPQHGKSIQIIDFISWITGHDPNIKVIFASFSDRLGIRANLHLQRIYDSEKFQRTFKTRINERNVATLIGRHLRNNQIIEFNGAEGYFRNTTVMGAVTGEGLDIGVVDDPIKGRAEASSKVVRDKTWDWLTDDFLTRFSDNGALLMIMTRWSLDDPVGRLIQRFPGMRVLRYPAIAEHDEQYRRAGDALFPELKPLDFLQERRKLLTEASWESIYQQNPIVVGGGILPIEKLKVVPFFDRTKVTATVRFWDKAGTASDDAAYTAGVRMHSMNDGTFVVSHVVRGQWTALDREEKIKAWTEIDASEFGSYEIYVEQEPGSGGKESAESTIRMLAGRRVYADRVTGDKVVRAEPFAAQVQGGNVGLVAGEWVTAYLDECEVFPAGKYKDQVDASSGAFSKLSARTAYLTDYSKWL
jgi:predicted phage terminase large subunit-like protein